MKQKMIAKIFVSFHLIFIELKEQATRGIATTPKICTETLFGMRSLHTDIILYHGAAFNISHLKVT